MIGFLFAGPPQGEALPSLRQRLHAVQCGATPWDAFRIHQGDTLAVVSMVGVVQTRDGKHWAREATVTRIVPAAGILAEFARCCALDCAALWNAPLDVVRALEVGEPAHLPPMPGKPSSRASALRCAAHAMTATRCARDGRTVALHAAAAWLALRDVNPALAAPARAYLNAEITLELST